MLFLARTNFDHLHDCTVDPVVEFYWALVSDIHKTSPKHERQNQTQNYVLLLICSASVIQQLTTVICKDLNPAAVLGG